VDKEMNNPNCSPRVNTRDQGKKEECGKEEEAQTKTV
jgi:hypothetical protein